MSAKQVVILLVVSVFLAACGQTPNPGEVKSSCLFRLPWTSTLGKIEVTQGNSDTQEKRSHRPGSVMEYAFDFAIPKDNPVLATREGTVSDIHDGETRAGGAELINNANYVIIDHGGGTFSLYAHLRAGISVSVGQKVVQGQVVGYVGNTGWTYGGYHLHYQVQKSGQGFGQSIPTCFQEVMRAPKERQQLYSLNQPVQVLGIQVTAEPKASTSGYEGMLGTWEGEVSLSSESGRPSEHVRFEIGGNGPSGAVWLTYASAPEPGPMPPVEDAMAPQMKCFGDGYNFYCFSLLDNDSLKYNGHGPLWAAEGVLHRSNSQGMLDMTDPNSIFALVKSGLERKDLSVLEQLLPEKICMAYGPAWCRDHPDVSRQDVLRLLKAHMVNDLSCFRYTVDEEGGGFLYLTVITVGWSPIWDSFWFRPEETRDQLLIGFTNKWSVQPDQSGTSRIASSKELRLDSILVGGYFHASCS